MLEIEDKIKQAVIRQGADICGVANIAAFGEAPASFHPTDIFPGCRSAVVFARRMPRGTALVSPRIVYNRFNDLNVLEVDRIAYGAALDIEKLGAVAVPLPSDSPYDEWNEENLRGQGILSMRHAAVLAGLGRLGRNTLVINEHLGNMMTIGAILTDLDLKSDPPAKELCLHNCRRCLENCPTQALDGTTVDQKRCRPNTYSTNARGFGLVNCNLCRTGCPLSAGARTSTPERAEAHA